MNIQTILNVDKNCLGFTFTDYKDYTIDNVSVATIEITAPNNNTVVADGTPLFQNNINTRTLKVPASSFGVDTLQGGVYQVNVTVAYSSGSIQETTRNSLVYCELKKCLLGKIGELAINRKDCTKEKLKTSIQQLYDLRVQLEAIQYKMDCGSLITAQEMYDDLVNACNNCDCNS